MKRLLLVFLLGWATFLVCPAWAQTPSPTPKGPPVPVEASLAQEPFKVTVKADKDHFELGQPVHLVYQIQGPETAQFTFPEAEKFVL